MLGTKIRGLLGLTILLGLTGCGDEPETMEQAVRPIRTFVVADIASGRVRQFTGTIEASNTSALSFQINGSVQEVKVSQGDQVAAGDVLAVLDPEPFRLNVQAAEADLKTARADVENNGAEYERQRSLYEQGWTARTRLEDARRDYRAATSRIDYTVARLDLAKRDLRNTELVAPFDGFIAERSVDPFVEVSAGQILFRIDAEGGFEAAFAVPENSIDQIVLGMPASVRLSLSGEPLDALITEIGSAAGSGNAFDVKAALIDPPGNVRTGMTADISVLLADASDEAGYLVPLTAVAAGDGPNQGVVFVYDADNSTVRRTAVEATSTAGSNMIAVKGVSAGDVIASAGVNFLVDGQKVGLLNPIAGASPDDADS